MRKFEKENIPRHIAFVMDGNGRWAKERGLPRTAGHREGIERVREMVSACKELGVGVVTFFAFSSENWSRPKIEVQMLLRYLDNFLDREIEKLRKNNIRFMVIGREDPIPGYLQKKLKEAINKTSSNTGLVVVLALNYGSKQEIVDAVVAFSQALAKGEASIDGLDADTFGRYLYTAGLPDPDLLIRTSGESRLSNFLLWQLSYAELYFPKKYWPDFKKDDLKKAIAEYQKRERRFGRVTDGHQKNN
jgi:undecaprenyl diphosphate synthase